MTLKLNAKQLRVSTVETAKTESRQIKKHPLVLVLDNVYDTYNIGSFFRLADAYAIQKIYLCGPVVTPPNLKIHRASVGTWKWVEWEHVYSTEDCLKKLKKDNYQILAIEQSQNSTTLEKLQITPPVALVLGNETHGVGEWVKKYADTYLELPMYGVNISMNVLIAGTVAVHEIVKKLN